MPKGSSGASDSVSVKDYQGLNTFPNIGFAYRTAGTNIPARGDPMIRIAVTPVTDGTDKQNQWATSIKQQMMSDIDELVTPQIERLNRMGEAKIANLYTLVRNDAMRNVNAINNAKHLIDGRNARKQDVLIGNVSSALLKTAQDEEMRLNARKR